MRDLTFNIKKGPFNARKLEAAGKQRYSLSSSRILEFVNLTEISFFFKSKKVYGRFLTQKDAHLAEKKRLLVEERLNTLKFAEYLTVLRNPGKYAKIRK